MLHRWCVCVMPFNCNFDSSAMQQALGLKVFVVVVAQNLHVFQCCKSVRMHHTHPCIRYQQAATTQQRCNMERLSPDDEAVVANTLGSESGVLHITGNFTGTEVQVTSPTAAFNSQLRARPVIHTPTMNTDIHKDKPCCMYKNLNPLQLYMCSIQWYCQSQG